MLFSLLSFYFFFRASATRTRGQLGRIAAVIWAAPRHRARSRAASTASEYRFARSDAWRRSSPRRDEIRRMPQVHTPVVVLAAPQSTNVRTNYYQIIYTIHKDAHHRRPGRDNRHTLKPWPGARTRR